MAKYSNISFAIAILIFSSFISLRLYKPFKTEVYNITNLILENRASKTPTLPLEYLPQLNQLDLRLLNLGAEEMKKHKIVISGITRDNIKDLAVMVSHIESIGAKFADYRVVIFENDSKDGTKQFLKMWKAKNPKINYSSQDFKLRKRPNIKFLADIRNKYIEEINKNPIYNDFDILAVIDMDMSYGIDIRGLEHTFSNYAKWEAVCSNGISNSRGDMYDMFAFRNEEFPMSPTGNYQKYWYENVPRGQKPYPMTSDLIKVDSCFGGLAFYKRAYLNGCSYDSIDGDCEHIIFHECLKKNGGKMFMNPAQLIRYSHYKELSETSKP